MEAWYPDAVRNPAVISPGMWASSPHPPRGVLHTVEADLFRPHPSLYYGRAGTHPHFTVGRGVDGVRTWQHYPITGPSRALRNLPGGVETNRLRAYQIEIVGRAGTIDQLDDATYAELARTMRWLEGQTGIPPLIRTMHPYPPPGGVRLGSEPWRMGFGEWLAFTGWCGHQHVPENVHGDPGALDTRRLLPQPPPFTVEDDEMRYPIDLVAGPPGPDGLVPIWRLTGPDGGIVTLNGAPFHGSLPSIGVTRTDAISLIPRKDRDGYTITCAETLPGWTSPTYSFP
jgi:hypothetical protein